MKININELKKPITKKKDEQFATLKEVLDGNISTKDDMSTDDYRDLSIVRYEMMDSNKAIVIGKVSYTKNQIIKEIKKQTEVGAKLVEMQVRFISMLLNKKEEIEIIE